MSGILWPNTAIGCDAGAVVVSVRLARLHAAAADARHQIEDADIAEETSQLARHQILSQGAGALLQVQRQNQQLILQMLEGIG